ncbi:MAG TPA: response regulator [Aestuariivirgaceae bacterium]|jgi:FixJ family two-component response regulator
MPGIAHITPTILIIDSDPAICNSLKFSLRVEGYTVRDYSSALELLAEPALPTDGCLVIDFHLPGLDGLQLLGALRQRTVTMPAILLATDPSGHLRVRAAKAGVPIIEKPLLTEALFQCIRATLADARTCRGTFDQDQ